MNRAGLAAMIVFATFALPGWSQTAPESEIKGFFEAYVQAFNKADGHTLASQFYAIPGVSPAAMEAKLNHQFAALRGDEFGKMNLFEAKPCIHDSAAEVEVSFEYQFTYGGQMPLGDQAAKFGLVFGKEGWRIASTQTLKPGERVACPKN